MMNSAPKTGDPGPHPKASGPSRAVRKWIALSAALLTALIIAGGFLWYALAHSGYAPVQNSVFDSPFVKGRNVLILVPHEDDEVNLAFGVVETFARAGSDVTIAFLTNGDAQGNPQARVGEAVRADAMLGVPATNLVFLGYGDHIADPPFYRGAPGAVRAGDAGRTRTFGVGGFTDYHTQRFGAPADYTLANLRQDLRQLLLDLRPDVIFVSDTDDHVDHVSLSMVFDSVLGKLLRQQQDYRPLVFKGFAYDYAWHGNEDFYRIPLPSAAHPWMPASYNGCYRWEERVRFVMPGEYLSYTLRGSKLYSLLRCYDSQKAYLKEGRLLNGDKVFWERRTDNLALIANVTASSGDAALLHDFILKGAWDHPLEGCWLPAQTDKRPVLHFSWEVPQDIHELVFYGPPTPGGDAPSVRVTFQGDEPVEYALPDTAGKPYRMRLDRPQVSGLSVEIASTGNGPWGLFEIEVLPARRTPLQWIKLMDENGDFCYELPCPARQALTLPLYGYPAAPAQAAATLWKDERMIASPAYDGSAFALPPLEAGRYRLQVTSGPCVDEVILRVGDTMVWQQGLQWLERRVRSLFPRM